MTEPLKAEKLTDVMIFATDVGPMMISRQRPHPQPVTDPKLLAFLYPEEVPAP